MQKAIKNEQNEKNHLYSNILDIDRKRRLSRKRKPRDKYNLIEKKERNNVYYSMLPDSCRNGSGIVTLTKEASMIWNGPEKIRWALCRLINC